MSRKFILNSPNLNAYEKMFIIKLVTKEMQTETLSLYTFQPGKISPVNQFLAGICIEHLIH